MAGEPWRRALLRWAAVAAIANAAAGAIVLAAVAMSGELSRARASEGCGWGALVVGVVWLLFVFQRWGVQQAAIFHRPGSLDYVDVEQMLDRRRWSEIFEVTVLAAGLAGGLSLAAVLVDRI